MEEQELIKHFKKLRLKLKDIDQPHVLSTYLVHIEMQLMTSNIDQKAIDKHLNTFALLREGLSAYNISKSDQAKFHILKICINKTLNELNAIIAQLENNAAVG